MINSYYRLCSLFLVIITFAVLLASFYFEYVRDLIPCPLCLMQRFCAVLLLIFTCMSFYFKRTLVLRKILILQIVVASAGIFFAGRQLWLQSLPSDQIPVCLPGLSMMMHYLPWSEIAHALFWGAGDCAQIVWTLFGFSMPAWTALYFAGMFCASLFSCIYLRKLIRPLA